MTAANVPQSTEKPINRRQFLIVVWAAASAALFGQAAVALYQFLRPAVQEGVFGGKVAAGNVKEFRVGTVSTIRSMHGFVSRVGPEGALVMAWKCPHLGCTVPWVEAEGKFDCPCHGSIYSTKGEVLAGPAPRPLDLYPAEIVDNQLIVDTSRVISRTHFDPSQIVPFPPGA